MSYVDSVVKRNSRMSQLTWRSANSLKCLSFLVWPFQLWKIERYTNKWKIGQKDKYRRFSGGRTNKQTNIEKHLKNDKLIEIVLNDEKTEGYPINTI